MCPWVKPLTSWLNQGFSWLGFLTLCVSSCPIERSSCQPCNRNIGPFLFLIICYFLYLLCPYGLRSGGLKPVSCSLCEDPLSALLMIMPSELDKKDSVMPLSSQLENRPQSFPVRIEARNGKIMPRVLGKKGCMRLIMGHRYRDEW